MARALAAAEGGVLTPVYVEPFLGCGSVWLALVDPLLVPPVSWMGGKRRLARKILSRLDLPVGCSPEAVLADASWWGWAWPVILDPELGARVSAVVRSWIGRDPVKLWFGLRDAGPLDGPAERVAQLLWLQARAANGVPVWWDDGRLVQHASTQIDAAGQRQGPEPRLVSSDGRGVPRLCGHKGFNRRKAGGMVNPGTLADRLDAIRSRRHGDVRIEHTGALSLTREWARRLGRRARVYIDAPYVDATGYPVDCPRGEVLDIADMWASFGERTVVSEAEGLARDLGRGWRQTQLVDGDKPEWITWYDASARRAA